MKKLLAIALAALLLVPAFAVAEGAFSLRNGYHWGMTVEDAKALAAKEGLTLIDEGDSGNIDYYLNYEGASVGDYTAHFNLLFTAADDYTPHELIYMAYDFDSLPVGSAEAEELQHHLQTNLTVKYGMGTVPTFRDRYASLCWPLDDAFIELMDSTLSPYHDTNTVEYAIHYTDNAYMGERYAISEGENTDGF